MNKTTEDTVPCELCGTPTYMTGTKRCDPCWGMERQIRNCPSAAMKVLQSMDGDYIADELVAKDAEMERLRCQIRMALARAVNLEEHLARGGSQEFQCSNSIGVVVNDLQYILREV